MKHRLKLNLPFGAVPHRLPNAFPDHGQRPSGAGGFTLTELLVALAVGGILLAIAMPNLQTFVHNSRIDNATDTFLTEIQRARSEAITRGEVIILCRTSDPSTDSCGGSGSKDWTPGWLMYTVPNFAVTGETNYASANHELIRRGTPAPEGVTITSDSEGNQWLTIGSDGTLNEAGTLAYAVCDDRGTKAGKLIVIPMIGRPHIAEDMSAAPNCEPA